MFAYFIFYMLITLNNSYNNWGWMMDIKGLVIFNLCGSV